MKLLLDQGLPRTAASVLRNAGFDAVHTGEIGMARAEDAAILEEARRSGRVVVTLDADFHALMALSGDASPSVIRIRIERLRGQQVADLVQDVLSQCGKQLEAGALVSVQQGRLRLRRLPLIR
jgi:predicted nuclease of predicted toxin-antitoxin system